jgi:hypothetical protein
MTIQTHTYSTQCIATSASNSPKEATSNDQLPLRAMTPKRTLTQKLNAFDPAVHGGELMADDSVGVEFGARVCVL